MRHKQSGWSTLRARHSGLPLQKEREQYLEHLARLGRSRFLLEATARYQIHVIRIMELTEMRTVSIEEIKLAGQSWAADVSPNRKCYVTRGRPGTFIRIAKQWLAFHGHLARNPLPPHWSQVNQYAKALSIQGLAASTIHTYKRKVEAFLRWVASQKLSLETLTISSVKDYLAIGRISGKKPATLACRTVSLRSFFEYTATQGWSRTDIAHRIRSPRVYRYQGPPRGPAWKDVLRLILGSREATSTNKRTHAILLLLSFYGLRVSEVARLQLMDFDWKSGYFTVHRSKQGGIQYFPIRRDMGDAVIRYIRDERPKTTCRRLFVNVGKPFGPHNTYQIYRFVRAVMERVGIKAPNLGPHALRHACATRLLSQGSSLQEIADFLGHRDLQAVGIYARHDERLLRRVAASTLTAVL
ncbi:site-specific integrase [Granulicella paludicola]|uniref:site-specific integrase n=1 Tax=Granulicella paludicola TaxID=474951 RepID=UPI0021E0EB34|nr:site-specific integrase [Granulicella paludicola]